MRVLFITTKGPLPVNEGHALRTFNLLKAACSRHEVTLMSCLKFPEETRFKRELEQMCSSVRQFAVPENDSRAVGAWSGVLNLGERRPYVARKYDIASLRSEIREASSAGKYDLVHLDMLPLGVYLDDIEAPVLLNEHNVESALLRRRVESTSNPVVRRYLQLQQRRLELFEGRVVSQVDHVLACSEEDRRQLSLLAPGQEISVVPNGVDTNFYRVTAEREEAQARLLFIGGMNWFPNRDAVNWFDREVLPLLLPQLPQVKLDVVGRPEPELAAVHQERVVMAGFVPDTRPYLERASVVVVPIRTGGGTRLKVLEAMSMGKALVSTKVGVEGIDAQHGRHLLIAETPADFARAIIRLVNDEPLRRRLGEAARELAVARYDWEIVGSRLLDAYQRTVEADAERGDVRRVEARG